MLSIPVCRVVSAVFVVSVFPDLDIHASANDENVVFRDATHKRGWLSLEGDEFSFFTNIGWAVAEDD